VPPDHPLQTIKTLMDEAPRELSGWFAGFGIDDCVWDTTRFTKNRDQLLEGDIAQAFLGAILSIPRVKRMLSSEHFSVDGTLIEAWAR
jgi:transposase